MTQDKNIDVQTADNGQKKADFTTTSEPRYRFINNSQPSKVRKPYKKVGWLWYLGALLSFILALIFYFLLIQPTILGGLVDDYTSSEYGKSAQLKLKNNLVANQLQQLNDLNKGLAGQGVQNSRLICNTELIIDQSQTTNQLENNITNQLTINTDLNSQNKIYFFKDNHLDIRYIELLDNFKQSSDQYFSLLNIFRNNIIQINDLQQLNKDCTTINDKELNTTESKNALNNICSSIADRYQALGVKGDNSSEEYTVLKPLFSSCINTNTINKDVFINQLSQLINLDQKKLTFTNQEDAIVKIHDTLDSQIFDFEKNTVNYYNNKIKFPNQFYFLNL